MFIIFCTIISENGDDFMQSCRTIIEQKTKFQIWQADQYEAGNIAKQSIKIQSLPQWILMISMYFTVYRFIRGFYVSLCISLHETLCNSLLRQHLFVRPTRNKRKRSRRMVIKAASKGDCNKVKPSSPGSLAKFDSIILWYFMYRFWNPMLVSRFGLLYIPNQMGSD